MQQTVAQRFCLSCGKDQPVHIETLRCQVCGHQTGRGDAAERARQQLAAQVVPNGVVRADVPKPEKLVLEETPQLRRWVEQTQALADTFQERAAKSAGFAERFQTEAKQLQLAAQAFAGLLGQIGIEPRARRPEAAGSTTQRHSGERRLLPGQWARKYDACVKCGTKERRHVAHGLCTRCIGTKS